ncbi:MAG: N-acetylmuramoyl-L-alanine amidase [Blastococcus sp.]
MNRRLRQCLLAGLAPVLLAGCGPAAAVNSSSAPESSVTGAGTTTSAASSTPPPAAATTKPAAPPPAVVVLDPGHDGGNATAHPQTNRLVAAGGITKPCDTVGAATDAGYPEHAFTLDVATRVADLLRQRGVTVVLTRTVDTGVGPCVDQRVAAATAARATLAVSIHADAAAAAVRGFHVVEPALAPDSGNAGILGPSSTAAAHVLATFAAATGEPRATYAGPLVHPGLTRRNDVAELNLARVPALFIACGNMRNAQDAALLADPAWRARAAQGVANGVLAYLGRL